MFWCSLCRRRTAESKLADTELQIEALDSKVSSLGQLLDSEKAAAESALKASEQSWQTRLDESASAAANGARATADEEARTVQSALQQQLEESNADKAVWHLSPCDRLPLCLYLCIQPCMLLMPAAY